MLLGRELEMQFRKLIELFICIFLFSFLTGFLGINIGENSKIEGRVIHAITNVPKPGLKVTARVKKAINIKEDKKYTERSALTDSNGKFLIKGLSPRYRYSVYVNDVKYVTDTRNVDPPKDNKTYVIQNPVRIIEPPQHRGINYWNWDINNWLVLKTNSNIKVKDTGIGAGMHGKYFSYLPTKNRDKNNVIKSNEWIAGKWARDLSVKGIYRITTPLVICPFGKLMNGFELHGIYHYPKSVHTFKRGHKNASIVIPEGYHIGIERFRIRHPFTTVLDEIKPGRPFHDR